MNLTNLGDLLQFRQEVDNKIIEVDPDKSIQRIYTGQQLESLAQSVAAYLSCTGLQPADRVAIVSSNSIEFIACYLGIMKLGATAVLISAKNSTTQIISMLQDSCVKFIFTDQQIDINLPMINLNNGLEKILINNSFKSYQPNENDTAAILHTSGSTGQPKRVLLTHRARLSILNSYSKIKILMANPMSHAMGMNCLDIHLHNKNDLIFLKYFNSLAYLKSIDQHKPIELIGVPSMFSMLLNEKKLLKTLDLSSVQNVTLSGGLTTQSLYDGLSQTFKQAKIHVRYGSTELGPGIFDPHATLPTPPLSVGCESSRASVRLVDGVLQVRTLSMMKGYDGKNDNFTQDGYYITNDQFEIDQNGFYYFVGRSDDMFKSGGNKIFPSEIERAVEQHPSVDKCVALPIKDPIKDFKPYAFVTLKQSAVTTSEDIILFLENKLARYQLPRQIWILDTMPLSAVNKIDKQRLKELAEQNLNI
jgi:acyl-coenzyme A synthetase/AMP-(fatty) acid ligase